MSIPPHYLQANKLKYTFGADSDLVVGDMEETNGEHTIHIRTNKELKATALQTILAQLSCGLRVVVTHLDGSPYTGQLEQLKNAEQFLRYAVRALEFHPYFVQGLKIGEKNARLIFSKTIIQNPYGGKDFKVEKAFKDVISQYPDFVIDYATSP